MNATILIRLLLTAIQILKLLWEFPTPIMSNKLFPRKLRHLKNKIKASVDSSELVSKLHEKLDLSSSSQLSGKSTENDLTLFLVFTLLEFQTSWKWKIGVQQLQGDSQNFCFYFILLIVFYICVPIPVFYFNNSAFLHFLFTFFKLGVLIVNRLKAIQGNLIGLLSTN